MENIRFICAQPANSYYTWQVEVVINNFIKHGVNPNQIDILCAINNDDVPEDWRKLQNHYNNVRFFFYNDTRSDFKYIPAIYFNLMSNHLKAHPELRNEVLFLHDSDIIFTRKPELDWVRKNNVWSISDTNSYINYDYIQQKENYIYEKMCEIVGIDKRIPKLMNSHSGGAQYIVNGEGWEFWDKVEKDAIRMYDYFCEVEPDYVKKYEGDYPIQKWTAGMWSLLWNAWLAGHETKVDERISFGWSTDPIDRVEKHWILHNAGVTSSDTGLFFKGAYINKLPYDEILEIDSNRASSYYWNEVKETALKSILVSNRKPYSENKYTQMQLNLYNELASQWSEQNRDPVVGSFHLQNDWDDYENLFKRLQNQSELVGLDFACGPGRNIVKYNGRFKRLDGVDISPINIEKAQTYTSNNGIKSVLYTSSGVDISVVPSETYDFVMSTIALQHICVYDIRYSIMKDIHRVLKDGGVFTAQMGFGSPSPSTVGYYENYYDAESSNRACDVCIETTEQLEKDLLKIGYKDFKYTIGPVGPGDCHPHWIYFSCIKTNTELASYSKLIELSKQFNLGFHLENSIDDSLKLSNHYHPWSMREHEAKIVYDLILQNGLKSGFEIATAFGISASVMGQALKITGGKLVTMDAYVEENFNYSGGYDINTKLVKNVHADGYKMAKALIEVLGITDNVALEIGWSPDDTGTIIDRTFGTTKLDFAFIDGGHTQAQIDADVKAVLPYLADDCILLFHDHVDVSEETKEFIRYNGFINEKNYHTGFNLYAYSKGNKILI